MNGARRAGIMAPTLLMMLVGTGVHAADDAAVSPMLDAPASQLTPEDVQALQQRVRDFAQLERYREENASLPPASATTPRVVFFGDSITEGWGRTGSGGFFPGKGYINRGISGQTTSQMLLRFRQDVIALKPAVVVILAGTNDIAGNTGPAPQAMIEANLQSMLELARVHGIAVILASVLPVSDYPWQPGIAPAARVRSLNAALKRHAQRMGVQYLDYHSALVNADGGLDRELAEDGVHPTAAGYARMAPLAQRAIDAALQKR